MLHNSKIVLQALALTALLCVASAIQIAAAKSPPKPQGLWVANEDNVSEFQGESLDESGDPNPKAAADLKGYGGLLSLTFDRHNDLWFTEIWTGSGAIFEVTHANLVSSKSGEPTKRRIILPGGPGVVNVGWLGLGFDSAGNLFVSNTSGQLLEMPAKQLNEKHPTPKILFTSKSFFPGQVRFDASNNLWVTQMHQQVWRFAPADRVEVGSSNPSLKVDIPNALAPVDFAFDSSGNLWIAGPAAGVDTIEMISATDLTGSGEISPPAAETITSSAFGSPGVATCLGGVAFDRSNDLWVSVRPPNIACDAETQVVEFSPQQLSAGGDLDPSVTIGQNSEQTNLLVPSSIGFGPAVK
jgi:sugar lactone lactonase YvrE